MKNQKNLTQEDIRHIESGGILEIEIPDNTLKNSITRITNISTTLEELAFGSDILQTAEHKYIREAILEMTEHLDMNIDDLKKQEKARVHNDD